LYSVIDRHTLKASRNCDAIKKSLRLSVSLLFCDLSMPLRTANKISREKTLTEQDDRFISEIKHQTIDIIFYFAALRAPQIMLDCCFHVRIYRSPLRYIIAVKFPFEQKSSLNIHLKRMCSSNRLKIYLIRTSVLFYYFINFKTSNSPRV